MIRERAQRNQPKSTIKAPSWSLLRCAQVIDSHLIFI
jgi:hypothetical protein